METHKEYDGKQYVPIADACAAAQFTLHEMREAYAHSKVAFRIFDKHIYVEKQSLMRLIDPAAALNLS